MHYAERTIPDAVLDTIERTCPDLANLVHRLRSPGWHRYVYGESPGLVPLVDAALDAELVRAAGFDPADPEVCCCELAADWHGHPAGSPVVTGPTTEGRPFAVQTDHGEPVCQLERCLASGALERMTARGRLPAAQCNALAEVAAGRPWGHMGLDS